MDRRRTEIIQKLIVEGVNRRTAYRKANKELKELGFEKVHAFCYDDEYSKVEWV